MSTDIQTCARHKRGGLAASTALWFTLTMLHSVPAAAQTAAPAGCQVKDRSDRVAVVVCAPGTTQAALQAAGADACKGRTSGCNAWIWEDASKAPTKAPAVDTDLPKATAGAARAVWIGDSQSLMELRKPR